MDGDLTASEEHQSKPADKKTQSLVEAKDRGQFTQTAAMSLVNIGLLKEIINQGREHRYFTVLISLISASLALQIMAGLISLFVANVKNFYGRYNDDPSGACCLHLCGCKCSCKTPKELGMSCCCPFECTTKVYEDHEYKILEQNAELQKSTFDSHLMEMKSKTEIQHLVMVLDHARSEEQRLRVMADDPKHEIDEVNFQLKGITEELAVALERKKVLEKELLRVETMRAESKALVVYAENIERNAVLKKITFWQNGINYLFYVVLVLNAFITGLGLSDGLSA